MADTPGEAKRKARHAAGEIARASQEGDVADEPKAPPATASKKGRGKKGGTLPVTDSVDLEADTGVFRKG